ncbi:MAG: helix-turn-helix domain-containing protein [Brevundimonas sp.]|uniref:helix-turn-helix domain-containing protein n=1 Tax=Brevundimonas sp. TaxID=1871086 RepID=UPI00271E01A9|nr:helix-turn-helix domain-containing protein [Brevundimonas sp.]MDO9078896.1 helix-turn-helix domain-containing protein [Brevundimonas sp.]MDP3081919.1 helix-turn-helix domain-containing protein [Brevundimonas sp.]MDZ4059920.1 helix-turn-helix domain-containing protein [Brevundimonas sp.]
MTAAARPSVVRIDETLSPRDRFDNWREAVSAVFDLEVEDPATFDCGMTSWKLGSLLLGGFRSSGNTFVRDRAKVARGGLDHYVVQTLIQGTSVLREGAPEAEWPRGSVRILDLTRTVRTEAQAFSNLTLIVPRAVLEPLLGAPDDLHGVTLEAETVGAQLLGGLMQDLSRRADAMTLAEAEALGPGVAAMVAACFGPSVAAAETARAARTAVSRRAIQSHVLAHLGSPDLSTDALCSRFGLSRATLYRLFEPLGGVEGWIRGARLDEACRRLSSPATLDRRVSRVAQDLGFVNETSFSRDFRRRFGVSPSEARQRLGDQAPLPGSTSGGVFRDWVCGDGPE